MPPVHIYQLLLRYGRNIAFSVEDSGSPKIELVVHRVVAVALGLDLEVFVFGPQLLCVSYGFPSARSRILKGHVGDVGPLILSTKNFSRSQ